MRLVQATPFEHRNFVRIGLSVEGVRDPCDRANGPGAWPKPMRDSTMQDATAERWLPVVGWEGSYEVSDRGRVRGIDRLVTDRIRTRRLKGKLLTLKTHKRGGYPMVILCRPGVQKTMCVHRMVCTAFHGPAPEGKSVIRHLNGNPTDNRPENLAWGTCKENTADMMRHGRAYWARQTHCIRGHEFSDRNTRLTVKPNGGRIRTCRACDALRSAPKNAARRRLKAAS